MNVSSDGRKLRLNFTANCSFSSGVFAEHRCENKQCSGIRLILSIKIM